MDSEPEPDSVGGRGPDPEPEPVGGKGPELEPDPVGGMGPEPESNLIGGAGPEPEPAPTQAQAGPAPVGRDEPDPKLVPGSVGPLFDA